MLAKSKTFEEGSKLWMMSGKGQPGNCQILEPERPAVKHQSDWKSPRVVSLGVERKEQL